MRGRYDGGKEIKLKGEDERPQSGSVDSSERERVPSSG